MIDRWDTYWTRKEDAVLELAEKVGDEETAQHQAHREQCSVRMGSFIWKDVCGVVGRMLVFQN